MPSCKSSSLRSLFIWPMALLASMLLIAMITTTTSAQDARKKVRDARENQRALLLFNGTAELQNGGLYAKAITSWDKFLQKYPNDKRAGKVSYYRGICLLHTQKYDEAAAQFRTVVTKYPKLENLDSAQFNLAMAYYQKADMSKKPEDFKNAAKEFGAVAAKFPSSKFADRALYYQGESAFAAGDNASAAAAYKNLTTKYVKSPLAANAFYALGIAQQQLKQNAEAAKTFKAFLANPELAKNALASEVRLRLGMSLFAEKKFADAAKYFGEASKGKDFSHADFAALRQAQCMYEAGKVAEAGTLYAELPTKFPQSTYLAAALLASGKCFVQVEKYPEAQKALEPLVGLRGNEGAEASYWLGRSLLRQNKPTEALTVLEASLKANIQGEFVPYLQLTRLDAMYEIPSRRKETAPLFAAFVRANGDHLLAPQALYMAALSAQDVGSFAAMKAHADAFLGNAKYAAHKLRPAVMFLAAEGLLLADKEVKPENTAKAEALYRELITKFPQHQNAAASQVRLGWCLLQGKKYDEAIAHLKTIVGTLKEPERKAEANLLIAQCYTDSKRTKEAAIAFQAAQEAKPDWVRGDEVLLGWAQSLRSNKDLTGAAQRLQELLSRFAKSPYRSQSTYQLGELAQGAKKYDDAMTRFREVITIFPKSEFVVHARYGLGTALFSKGDFTAAATALSDLITNHSDNELASKGLLWRGLSYQQLKQFPAASKDLTEYLAKIPNSPESTDARYALARCLASQSKHAEAAAAFEAVLKANADYANADKANYHLAYSLLELKQEAKAIESFRALVKRWPNSPMVGECWFQVGRHHEQKWTDAKDNATKAAELKKASDAFTAGVAKAAKGELREKLQYKLGGMQFQQNDYAGASTTLLAQITENATGSLASPARFLAAVCLFRQDKFNEALPLFAKVVADKDEKYMDQALYQAGTCAKNLKRWPEAQTFYKQLVDQFAKFEQINEARYGLAWSLQNQNKFSEARTIYQQIIDTATAELTETSAKAAFMIGEIAFAEKKHEDAVAQFLFVAGAYPFPEWQAKARYEAGRCFQQLGNTKKAIQSLQQVVDKFPKQPEAKAATALIAKLKQTK